MLKFKMSLLLQSAKFRVAVAVLAITAIIAGIVFIPKNKAGVPSNSVLIACRTTGAKVAGNNVYSHRRDTDKDATGYDNIFCIEEDQNLSYAEFTNPMEFSSAKEYFNFPNAAGWLINNMYVTNVSGLGGLSDEAAKNVLLMNMANLCTTQEIKNQVASLFGFDGSSIAPQDIYQLKNVTIGSDGQYTYSKNALEVVEQFALWQYTKNQGKTVSDAYRNNPNQYIEGTSLTEGQQKALKYTYYALTVLADLRNDRAYSNDIARGIELNTNSASFNEDSYKVGPYYLESNGFRLTAFNFGSSSEGKYPINVTITKNDGSKVTVENQLVEKNNDGSFYINLNDYRDNVKNVSFSVAFMTSTIHTEAYVLDGGDNQNIMTIQKSVGATSLSDSKDIVIKAPEGKYSIVLNKVKEDGETVISDLPATFKVNGNEKTTNKGVLTIENERKIENTNQSDSYEIVETKAPDGYKAFNGTMKLNVKFKESGKSYIIDKDKTTTEGFANGARVEVSPENAKITIYVPNTQKIFDLSLRKFISKIDGKDVKPSREPVINEQSIKNLQETGTASYYHSKNSLEVLVGSEVEYTIRVYNEGEILGYAKQITDYIPDGLTFVRIADESKKQYATNAKLGDKVITLDYNGHTEIQTLRDFFGKKDIKVTDKYYQEVKVICKVENTEKTYLTSRAEITRYGYSAKGEEGKVLWKEAKAIGDVDRDSVQNTIKDALDLDNWYENATERTYKDKNGKVVVDKNYFPGVQDDDDFETVELLAGKYNIVIKKVDATDSKTVLPGAYFGVKGPNIDKEVGPTNANGEVSVIKGVKILDDKQIDEYTITETKSPVNYHSYNGEIKVKIATKNNGKVFVIDEKNTKVNGKDVRFVTNKENTTITIIVPDVKKEFDLSLRKFITDVNGKELEESRVPQVDTTKLASGESTTATYTHPKNPVDVNPKDIVTYTIRVFNEGEIDGYASKVMDDIPSGLEFLPENEINKEYGWVMYREVKADEKVTGNTMTYNNKKYVVTDKANEADYIVTNHLENSLIKAFDKQTKTLDYKDVKVAFKVVEPETSDRIITNYAQITEHKDNEGNPVIDRDSTPNEWNEGEDDQDIDKVKVRYFDLALRKWVTKAIVYENGKETVTETNHGPWDDPEPVVKVDLKNTSIDSVTIKFEYSIRIFNQGELPGYAKEISDYIPQGLKFVQEDNPEWKEVDGKIVTRALENTLLQPGEYADVTVLLTWINGKDNLGTKVNVAEISEDYNDWGTPDIDSTPNNKVPGEDDIDDAPVILTVRTGTPIIYTGIAIMAISIVSVGIVLIRKRVLK